MNNWTAEDERKFQQMKDARDVVMHDRLSKLEAALKQAGINAHSANGVATNVASHADKLVKVLIPYCKHSNWVDNSPQASETPDPPMDEDYDERQRKREKLLDDVEGKLFPGERIESLQTKQRPPLPKPPGTRRE